MLQLTLISNSFYQLKYHLTLQTKIKPKKNNATVSELRGHGNFLNNNSVLIIYKDVLCNLKAEDMSSSWLSHDALWSFISFYKRWYISC